jgi:MFS family permease
VGARGARLAEVAVAEPGSGRLGLSVGLVLGVVLVAFEVTAITTVMPTISDEFGGDSLYGVTLACYTLANLASLVTAGELTDRFGALRPYLGFLALFVGGLIVAALAPSMVVIVLGRTLQGFGTGGLGPIAYSLVKRGYPAQQQPIMYVWLSAGWVLPSLVAPLVAGAITTAFGWQWVFAGMVPLPVMVALVVARPMRAFGPAGAGRNTPSPVPAAFAAAAAIGLLVTGLQFTNLVAATLSAAVGVAAALASLRRLFPPGVWRAAPGLPAVLAVRIIATAAFLGVDSFVPLAADRIHGATPLAQGFVIIGAALTWTAGQFIMARRPHTTPRRAVFVGFGIQIVGIAATSIVLSERTELWMVFIAWMVGGLGMGLLYNPSTVAGMSYATEGREGLVSGQMGLADAIGFSLMGGIGGATVAVADRTAWPLSSALGTNFALAAVLALVGMFAARGVREAQAAAATSAGMPAPISSTKLSQ